MFKLMGFVVACRGVIAQQQESLQYNLKPRFNEMEKRAQGGIRLNLLHPADSDQYP